MREPPSVESLRTVSRASLVISAVLAVTAVVAVATTWSERRETIELQSELLSQAALQERLLSSQASDHSLYPHVDPTIGFVLNPHMKRSSWGASEGSDYAVNSVGLRGDEIARKSAGVTRILIVGDSYVFGWKLHDEERIAEVMNRLLEDRLRAGRYEVLTVALPGWNVLSQKSFLENHLDLLQPDFVVWKPLRNDVEDVAGAVPPGILASWNSPQKSAQTPVTFGVDFHKDLTMPFVMQRWDASLAAMHTVSTRYGIPLLVVGLNPHKRPFFEMLLDRSALQAPTLTVPSRFTDDRRLWCVSESDCHPSPEAARILALGILDKLARLGVLPSLQLTTDEKAVVAAFQEEEQQTVSREEARRFIQEQYSRLPSSFEAGDRRGRRSVLYGLEVASGAARPQGLLFLRDDADSSHLVVELETPPNPGGYPRSVRFAVRDPEGHTSELGIDLESPTVRVRIPLPQGDLTAYELSWTFDYASCSNPASCTSAKVRSVRFSGS